MSRVVPKVVGFDDASSTNVTLSLGSVNVSGAFTLAAAVKRSTGFTSFDTALEVATSTPTSCVTLQVDGSNNIAGDIDGAFNFTGVGVTALVNDEWHIWIFGKSTGTVQPRVSAYRFSTQAWSHGDCVSTAANSVRTAATSRLGEYNGTTDRLKGFIAAAAVWGSNLSDANRQTLATNLDAWVALGPQAMWVANGGTAIADEIGTANETTRAAGVTDASGTETSPLQWSVPVGQVPLAASISYVG